MNSCDELDLLELFQKLFPEISFKQWEIDNPTAEFVSLFYQQFRNKLYLILSDALKDVEPDEGKRIDYDNIYSIVRFVNFTTLFVYPNTNDRTTFKLLNFTTGKLFKLHVRPLLILLWNIEHEFTKVKDRLFERFLDFKKLQDKRVILNDIKKALAVNVSARTEAEKQLTDLQKSREKVQVRFKKLSQQQDVEKLTSEKLKKEVHTILEEHDNLQVLVTNIKANIEHLNKQIVPEDSYKQLLSVKENVNEICSGIKNEQGTIQENLRAKTLAIETYYKIEVHTNELNTLSNDVTTLLEQYSETLDKCKLYAKKVQEITDKIQKLNSSKVHFNNKIKTRKAAIRNTTVKKLESVEQLGQGLFEIKEQLIQEKENQEQQTTRKQKLEKVVSNLNKLCLVIKQDIDNVNISHKHSYQKLIKLENTNTETLSNALACILKFQN